MLAQGTPLLPADGPKQHGQAEEDESDRSFGEETERKQAEHQQTPAPFAAAGVLMDEGEITQQAACHAGAEEHIRRDASTEREDGTARRRHRDAQQPRAGAGVAFHDDIEQTQQCEDGQQARQPRGELVFAEQSHGAGCGPEVERRFAEERQMLLVHPYAGRYPVAGGSHLLRHLGVAPLRGIGDRQ
jgi:hypothetical protein